MPDSKTFEKYTNPSNAGAFAGLSGFLKNNNDLLKEEVKQNLEKLTAFTLHKPQRLTYKRLKVEVSGIDAQWQVDLIDINNISGSNYGMKYIFTCIDVFSKKAWAVLIKNKQADSCTAALRKIITESKRIPNHIYLDNGKYYNTLVSYFHNIFYYI